MSLGHGASVVRNGIVLHLDAANKKSYSGTGTTWADLSGLGNNGTLVNGVGYSSDTAGSLVFDGTNDRVDCGTTLPDTISGTNGFTIEVCAYPENSQNAYADIWGNHNEPYKGIVLQQNGSNLNQYNWAFGVGTAWKNGSNFFYLTTRQYNHLVCIRAYPYCYTYLNGVLIDTSGPHNDSLVVNSVYNLQLGVGWHLDSSRYWRGRLSNFKVYNRALSAAEVRQNFEALRGRYGI
jgi:hypothetical protein